MIEVMNRDFQTAKLNMGFNVARTLIFGLENLCVFWLGAKIILPSQTQDHSASAFTVGMLLANAPVVYLGDRLVSRLPLGAVRIGAALLFLALGVWVLATA